MSENACEINVSTGLENPEARIDDEGEPNVDTEEKVPPSLVNFFENYDIRGKHFFNLSQN